MVRTVVCACLFSFCTVAELYCGWLSSHVGPGG